MIIKNGAKLFEGETFFSRKINKFMIKDKTSIFIDRIYARAGMVVIEYLNYNTNKGEFLYLKPEEAIARIRAIMNMNPEWVQDGLLPAVMKAYGCALNQTADGYSKIFKEIDYDVEEQSAELEEALKQARIADPELHAEMCKVEIAAGVSPMELPQMKKADGSELTLEDSILPDAEIEL